MSFTLKKGPLGYAKTNETPVGVIQRIIAVLSTSYQDISDSDFLSVIDILNDMDYQIAGDLIIAHELYSKDDKLISQMVDKAVRELKGRLGLNGDEDLSKGVDRFKKLRNIIKEGIETVNTQIRQHATFSPLFSSIVKDRMFYRLHPTTSLPTMGVVIGDPLLNISYNPVFVYLLSSYDKSYITLEKEHIKKSILNNLKKGKPLAIKVPNTLATVLTHEFYHYFLGHSTDEALSKNYINRIVKNLGNNLKDIILKDKDKQHLILNYVEDLIINDFFINGKTGLSKAAIKEEFNNYYPKEVFNIKISDLFDAEEIKSLNLDPSTKIPVYITISVYYVHRLITKKEPSAIGALSYEILGLEKPNNIEDAVDNFHKVIEKLNLIQQPPQGSFFVQNDRGQHSQDNKQELDSQDNDSQENKQELEGEQSQSGGGTSSSKQKLNKEQSQSGSGGTFFNKEKPENGQSQSGGETSPDMQKLKKLAEEVKKEYYENLEKLRNEQVKNKKEADLKEEAKNINEIKKTLEKELEKLSNSDSLSKRKEEEKKRLEKMIDSLKEKESDILQEIEDREKNIGTGAGNKTTFEAGVFDNFKSINDLADGLLLELSKTLSDFVYTGHSYFESGYYDRRSISLYPYMATHYPELARLERDYYKEKPKGVIFVVDASGSMSTKDLNTALSAIKSVQDEFHVPVSILVLGDSKEDIAFFEDVKELEDLKNEKVDRGGGTNMTKAFEYLVEYERENGGFLYKNNTIVFLTDGETPWEIANSDVEREVRYVLDANDVKTKLVLITDNYVSPSDYLNSFKDARQWFTEMDIHVIDKKSLYKKNEFSLDL